MAEIEEAIARQDAPPLLEGRKKYVGRFGLFKELWWKGNRSRVLIAIGLMFGQNMTGIQGVNFYTPRIFESIGFNGTKVVLLASGMFILPSFTFNARSQCAKRGVGMYAVVKTTTTILSLVFFVDRAGRRKLLLTSSVGTSLALWYIGAFVTVRHVDILHPQAKSVAGWVAIVCVYVYAVSISHPSLSLSLSGRV